MGAPTPHSQLHVFPTSRAVHPQSRCSTHDSHVFATPLFTRKLHPSPPVSFSLRLCLELAQTLPKNNPGGSPSPGCRGSCAGQAKAEISLVFGAHFGHLWHLSVLTGTKCRRFSFPAFPSSPGLTSAPRRPHLWKHKAFSWRGLRDVAHTNP